MRQSTIWSVDRQGHSLSIQSKRSTEQKRSHNEFDLTKQAQELDWREDAHGEIVVFQNRVDTEISV
jgi:hypothetical protein